MISFEKVIEENKTRIFRICQAYADGHMEAQDLFQEVAFQVWRSLPSFKGKSSISTWIYRISLNVCMRSKMNLDKERQRLSNTQIIDFEEPEGFEEDYDRKSRALRSCVSEMAPLEKTIVTLYLEDLSYREISEITGLTENHIAVKMKRMRKSLFACINSKLQEDGRD